jgi:hypothetical protein
VDVKPKKDTVCLIGILEGKEALTFLINAEDVELVEIKSDTIKINGGEFGGLTITPKLVEELNKNNAILEAILQVISTPVNEPGNGSPSAFQFALNTALAGKQTGDFSEIENEKILH